MSEAFNLDDVQTIEEGADSPIDYYLSLQRAINSLHAWKMQGSMGRAMMDAIEGGYCMLAESDTRDYWGNHIPSRDQIEEGTKGSYSFVAKQHGEGWAKAMESA